ncbi:hypothetical protein GCM10007874_31640 [Labrys miyagiensis]|uniref:Uncharacterized protein n=1 Tax=Labrys miyagiensis TaxID=346912 RepID=A0ABQ6CIG8_9HYPH|nr:hypothetical protein [Labrys miyagiensis]GLS20147.1 hypothetical protein GCM10007874_31640 [Labrys miyagiensis]
MSRLLQVGILSAGLVLTTSALAAPAAPITPSGSNSTISIRYHGGYCPPGSKLTSQGGCKVTDWTRHHPAQNPNRYNRYNYGNGYYDENRYNYGNGSYDEQRLPLRAFGFRRSEPDYGYDQ